MKLVSATEMDIPFAESLVIHNMDPYFREYGMNWDPDRFRENWAQAIPLILESEGSRAGYVSLVMDDTCTYISDLHIVAAHQGKGIGSWVMRQVEQMSRDRNLFKLRLRTFHSSPATMFYRKLGFEIKKYEEATVGMEKVLTMSCTSEEAVLIGQVTSDES